jgi:hypothetical protein
MKSVYLVQQEPRRCLLGFELQGDRLPLFRRVDVILQSFIKIKDTHHGVDDRENHQQQRDACE